MKLFKFIRHIRETSCSPPKLLKGVCKSQLEIGSEDEEGEQGEEETSGFSDDECVDVEPAKGSGSSSSTPSPKMDPPKKASKDTASSVLPTPCRRFSRKGSVDLDDVQILATGKSKDRLELDELLKQIASLELSKCGP